jgi:predicted nuclease of predicted toxin-antitoxin system
MTPRLLYDNNLPYRLINRLEDIFPGASHVYVAGMNESSDLEIWRFASENNYAIVTKDSDFSDLSILLGAPPKVIWLRIGNASVKDCHVILRSHYATIIDFLDDPDTQLLSIARE